MRISDWSSDVCSSDLAKDERFEEAGIHRDRLATFLRAAARTQRLSALSRCAEVVAARREDDGRWTVHVIRHGRLAGAGVIPPGLDAHSFVHPLRLSSESVATGPGHRKSGVEGKRGTGPVDL